jgi:hypothetical protein
MATSVQPIARLCSLVSFSESSSNCFSLHRSGKLAARHVFLETASVTLFKWMPCAEIVGAVTPPEMMKKAD